MNDSIKAIEESAKIAEQFMDGTHFFWLRVWAKEAGLSIDQFLMRGASLFMTINKGTLYDKAFKEAKRRNISVNLLFANALRKELGMRQIPEKKPKSVDELLKAADDAMARASKAHKAKKKPIRARTDGKQQPDRRIDPR